MTNFGNLFQESSASISHEFDDLVLSSTRSAYGADCGTTYQYQDLDMRDPDGKIGVADIAAIAEWHWPQHTRANEEGSTSGDHVRTQLS